MMTGDRVFGVVKMISLQAIEEEGAKEGGGGNRHEEIIKIKGIYVASKIDARPVTFTSWPAMADTVLSPFPPPILRLSVSRRARGNYP